MSALHLSDALAIRFPTPLEFWLPLWLALRIINPRDSGLRPALIPEPGSELFDIQLVL
jgi:hypothetical protein